MLTFERTQGTITLKGFNWSCSEELTPPGRKPQASSDLPLDCPSASLFFPFEHEL